jgi:hypothetical protein
MTVQQQIDAYIAAQSESKRDEMRALNQRILRIAPNAKLWFLDGKDSGGKVVTNPNIGYGSTTIRYAKGEVREFYKVGISGNTTGISVYVMGLDDKTYLAATFGTRLGKASVSGYCIKFRSLNDLDLDVLDEVIRTSLQPASA